MNSQPSPIYIILVHQKDWQWMNEWKQEEKKIQSNGTTKKKFSNLRKKMMIISIQIWLLLLFGVGVYQLLFAYLGMIISGELKSKKKITQSKAKKN